MQQSQICTLSALWRRPQLPSALPRYSRYSFFHSIYFFQGAVAARTVVGSLGGHLGDAKHKACTNAAIWATHRRHIILVTPIACHPFAAPPLPCPPLQFIAFHHIICFVVSCIYTLIKKLAGLLATRLCLPALYLPVLAIRSPWLSASLAELWGKRW